LDVLSGEPGWGRERDGKIAWYENTDGKGIFGQQRIITTAANGTGWVLAADADGDGDQDVLASLGSMDNFGIWSGEIVLFENTGGVGTFGEQKVVSTAADVPLSEYAADRDGDGTVDVLSVGGGTIHSLAPFLEHSYGTDLDDDGDADLIYAHEVLLGVYWYENTDGIGGFGQRHGIVNTDEVPSAVYPADFDGDGDVDVLFAAWDTIAWAESLSPPPPDPVGDANRDLQFDQHDIVQVLQAGKFRTGEPATWEEGDWNGDGFFDQLDIVAALQTGNYLQGTYAAVDAVFSAIDG
jgi:hypothetical protein